MFTVFLIATMSLKSITEPLTVSMNTRFMFCSPYYVIEFASSSVLLLKLAIASSCQNSFYQSVISFCFLYEAFFASSSVSNHGDDDITGGFPQLQT
jgi:hypothetical protein